MRADEKYLKSFYQKALPWFQMLMHTSLVMAFLSVLVLAATSFIAPIPLAIVGIAIALIAIGALGVGIFTYRAYRSYQNYRLPDNLIENYLCLAPEEKSSANLEVNKFLRNKMKLFLGVAALAFTIAAAGMLIFYLPVIAAPVLFKLVSLSIAMFSLPIFSIYLGIAGCNYLETRKKLLDDSPLIFCSSTDYCAALTARISRMQQATTDLQRQAADLRRQAVDAPARQGRMRRRRASSASTLFGDEKIEMNPPDNDLDSEETLLAGVVSARRVSI